MDCIQCDVCSKWQHASCATLDFPFKLYVERDLPYFCSIKCELTLLPFNQVNNVKFQEHLNLYPCKICIDKCVTDWILCDVCEKWLHFKCSDKPMTELQALGESDKPFICCDRCEMRLSVVL